jgi:hypothetical protein
MQCLYDGVPVRCRLQQGGGGRSACLKCAKRSRSFQSKSIAGGATKWMLCYVLVMQHPAIGLLDGYDQGVTQCLCDVVPVWSLLTM